MRAQRVSIFISGSIILTNFYFLVLYLAAERLKIGMIFFFFSMIYIGRVRQFYALAFLSIAGHFQLLIMYLSPLFVYFSSEYKRILSSKHLLRNNTLLFLLCLGGLFLIREPLLIKFYSYYEPRGVVDILRIMVFASLSLWYSSERKEVLFDPKFYLISLR